MFFYVYRRIVLLYQVSDKLLAVTLQHIDNRNLNHCVATRLLTHRSTGYINKYLTSKSRVVDAHSKLHALVLCLAANTLADKMNTMTHIAYSIYRRNSKYMSLVVGKVRVGLNGSCNVFKVGTILKLNVYHTAMQSLALRNSH